MTNHDVHIILAATIVLVGFVLIVYVGVDIIDLMCGVRRPSGIKKATLVVNFVVMALAAFLIGCILRMV